MSGNAPRYVVESRGGERSFMHPDPFDTREQAEAAMKHEHYPSAWTVAPGKCRDCGYLYGQCDWGVAHTVERTRRGPGGVG
jgi:hypothetical protein